MLVYVNRVLPLIDTGKTPELRESPKTNTTVHYLKGYCTPQGNLVKDSYASSWSIIIGYGKNVFGYMDNPQPSPNVTKVTME